MGRKDYQSFQLMFMLHSFYQDLGLSCPEELFDWEIFKEDPRPFYRFAKKLYFPLGSSQPVRPSDSHKLLALLEQKKMLLRVYSQNIDGTVTAVDVSMPNVRTNFSFGTVYAFSI